MVKDKDPIISILKEIHSQVSYDIPFNLLMKCYEIEKSFIFEKDRTKPMSSIKQIIEDYINEITQ